MLHHLLVPSRARRAPTGYYTGGLPCSTIRYGPPQKGSTTLTRETQPASQDRGAGPGYADAHVHLHAYPDPSGLLQRARAAGISLVVGVGVDLESSRRTIEIARTEPGVVAAVGLHPSYLSEAPTPDDLAELSALAADPTVGMIGEIGLDAEEARAPIEVQDEALGALLRLAAAHGLAANLHVRGAHDRLFHRLKTETRPPQAFLHYFVGDWPLAKQALDHGLDLSVGKPVGRAENTALREAIRRVPLDRLLLETDSYPLPGRLTEPAEVVGVARAVAELKGIAPEAVAATTTQNVLALLR